MIPLASPRYSPSAELEEWNALTSVKRIPSTSCEPPLLRPGACPSSGAPARPSQLLSSTWQMTCASGKACESATASPVWSTWPCVSAMMSTRAGVRSDSGVLGFPFNHGST